MKRLIFLSTLLIFALASTAQPLLIPKGIKALTHTITPTEISYLHGVSGPIETTFLKVSDGVLGSTLYYEKDAIDLMLDNAIKKSGLLRRVCQNNVQVSHTGTAAETTVLTMTIPANSIGLNGSFHILPLYSCTGTGNKIFRVKFNGTTVAMATIATTTATGQYYHVIRSRNSSTAHISGSVASGQGGMFGIASTTVSAPSFANTETITVTVTVELVTTTEQGNVEGIEIYASY